MSGPRRQDGRLAPFATGYRVRLLEQGYTPGTGWIQRTSQHFPDFEEVVLSSRRVKKGPGRRSLSAKRQRFMDLRAQGWSIRGAAREVGISRSAAANWTRGYNVYRDGGAVRFVEPLDRLEVREISARYLSQQERIEIADLHHEGVGVREISRRVGRSPSTISWELRRNRTGGRRPGSAHLRRTVARARVAPGASIPTTTSAVSSPSYWRSVGARNRSAGSYASASPKNRRCGCRMRASTRPSMSRDHR